MPFHNQKMKVVMLLTLSLAFASVGPYPGAREWLTGLWAGYTGHDYSELYDTCLPDQQQFNIQSSIRKISTDYMADASISAIFEDIVAVFDKITPVYETCNVYVIPDKFLDTILVEGPFFLIRIILNLEAVVEDFYSFVENWGTDMQTSGTKCGEMFAQFVPQDPWMPLHADEPRELGLGFFNPMNFTDGFITGLQEDHTADSKCLNSVNGVKPLIAKFYGEILNCLLLQFDSCIAITDIGDDMIEFFQALDLNCKLGELGSKFEALLSWTGIYGVFTNYYYYEKPIDDALLNAITSWGSGDWYQLGLDFGEVFRMIFNFNLD